jgi:succinate dehydrogenase / fumarate reductase iron-sulfur subunit
MCMTRMSTFQPDETVTVTPMRAFPIVRDLVTDVSFNYEKAREVPAFAPPPDLVPGQYRMAQIDVERSQEFRKCIECYLCQNTCHVIRDHEENKPRYSGPRFFIRIAELDMHPLDVLDRRRAAQDEAGLGYCNITKCCTEVCPEGIHITDNGIIPMKERVVDAKYDPVFVSGARIPTRADKAAAAALDGGDSERAEALARQRLVDKPSDQAALGVLTRSLVIQGRFAEAAGYGRQRIALVGSRGRQRNSAATDLAWSLLCAVEAGQQDDDDETRATIDDQMLTAARLTGSVLIAHKEALHQLYLGDLVRAEREIDQVLSWHRPPEERSDALLTQARLRHMQGDPAGAETSLRAARQLAPANPRIPAVEAVLGRS